MTVRARWKEFRAEVARVSWPSGGVTGRATMGVLYLLVIVILFLGLLDFLLQFLMGVLRG